jgi:L-amino acid N-acyltransferase YncA
VRNRCQTRPMLLANWPVGNIGVDTWSGCPYDPRMHACRLARTTDATAIHGIYAPVVRDTPISFEVEAPGVEEMASRIEKVLTGRPWLVYEEAGEILGYSYATTFRDRPAYNWSTEVSIYVRPDAHGRGLGRHLYKTLFEVLRAQNYCCVVAGATVPNAGSERLHETMGFQLIGRYPAAGYKFGAWHDVVFWYMRLRELPEKPLELININELVKTAEWSWLTRS